MSFVGWIPRRESDSFIEAGALLGLGLGGFVGWENLQFGMRVTVGRMNNYYVKNNAFLASSLLIVRVPIRW